MSAENKRQPFIQEKKAALREVPNNSKQAETPSKDKISVSAPSANKVAGTKRPNPSSPSSPLTYTYVRRRLESEQGKVNSAHNIKEETAKKQNVQISQEAQVAQNLQSSQEPQNLQSSKNLENLQNESKGKVSDAAKPQDGCKLDVIEATKLQNGSHEEMRETTNKQNGVVSEAAKKQNGSKGEVSKPQIGIKGEFREATKLQNGNKVDSSEASKLASLTASQDWKERFIRLQAFLKSCDQSNQEDYIRMLRSLSAVGRSKHAIELEKRAIHLLLEEGKELHRMKVLNVLGKGASSDPSLYPSQLSTPSRPQLQR
ncbi:hypothetical protein LUZ63_002500 [Rhynchospora breviuscula]|uniref:Uncharacterized protein n=1 Tax=Rhynchospora breviuscula TaxID=2022672 RepID=A0A9Q0CYX0_9POAL|nr:hypothetical protein LUZ63_002500 [Rhynchospora breviuscula]